MNTVQLGLTLCQSKFFNVDAERLAAGYRKGREGENT